MAVEEQQIIAEIAHAANLERLNALRIDTLGRNGSVTLSLRKIGTLPPSERAKEGGRLNGIREKIELALTARASELADMADAVIVAQPFDVTAPGLQKQLGHRHPVGQVLDELVDLFWQMGYQVADGPEIETAWYNFEALNIPADHPARDLQDTFYLKNGFVPRTHTSSVQIRYLMENHDILPVRIIAPGKVYRNEDEDARHSWSFYQLEGLVVDEGISVADLKGTLEAMMRGILGSETKIRLRPNYFPYTEPSVEMDASCVICHGTGKIHNSVICRLCGGSGWLELGGAGMVHPQVLRNVGIDSERYSGFAFGFGPERIAAIKFGVDDVRQFWRPDFKFLEQF